MKILIVSSEAPPVTSGVSRCVDRLATGLRARGHHVDVLSSLQVPRMAMHEMRLSSLGMHWRRIAAGLQDYDLVNLHGPAPTVSDVFLHRISRLPADRRPRVVYTHHGPMAIPRFGIACTVYNTAHRVLSRRSDLVVTSSRDYAEYHFMPGGPPVAVVPWGVDRLPATDRNPADRRDASTLRVLFVGQMRPYKGVDTLLAAAAGQPSLELTLVGRGPKLDHYKRLAARLGADNVTFRGWLPDARVLAEYARHDVIVLPSVTTAEAFGLVLLEGMRSGCVPVASDLPGVREVAGPTGALVPPGDTDALRETLVALARDRTRLERLRPLSVRRAADLSWDMCVDRYEDLFELTLRGGRPAGIGAGIATARPWDGHGEARGNGAAGGDGQGRAAGRNGGPARRSDPELPLDTSLRLSTGDLVLDLRGEGSHRHERRETGERREIRERV